MTPATRALDTAGIPYRVLRYDLEADDEPVGVAAARALGLPTGQVYKTLVVATGDAAWATIVLGVADRLDTGAAAAALGVRSVRMAEERDARRVTGYVPGGISPFGQKRALPTVLDASASHHDEIFVSGGRRGLEIGCSPADLEAVLDATVAGVAADR